jgi:hypothetical protein
MPENRQGKRAELGVGHFRDNQDGRDCRKLLARMTAMSLFSSGCGSRDR